MRRVVVIGAGASGMMAAITAARQGSQVTVLEHTSRSGRKLEITGNGRCNYTNEVQGMQYYHSGNPQFVESILDQFTYKQTIRFFEELGIVPKNKNGYYYPFSGQAQAVAQALRREAEYCKVRFACNIEIESIRRERLFEIGVKGYVYTADAVILCTGSKAAPATGSDGSGYTLAEKLGHRIKKPLPALVQLISREREIAFLSGLRVQGSVTLVVDGIPSGREYGEIQFIKNGLSGIPVFQLSGQAARALEQGRQVCIGVNFLEAAAWEDPDEVLLRRKQRMQEKGSLMTQFLCGLLHEKAAKAVLSRMRLKAGTPMKEVTKQQWEHLFELLQNMEFRIERAGSYEQAQVCSGGVVLSELKEGQLESRLVEGLYFAGEILDVDGACGGYNLQWAWASGYAAGIHAAQDKRQAYSIAED